MPANMSMLKNSDAAVNVVFAIQYVSPGKEALANVRIHSEVA